jgi:hypothetical protein
MLREKDGKSEEFKVLRKVRKEKTESKKPFDPPVHFFLLSSPPYFLNFTN